MSYAPYSAGEDLTQYWADIASGVTAQTTQDAKIGTGLANVTRYRAQAQVAAGDPGVTAIGSGAIRSQPPGYTAPYSGN